MTRVAWLTDIHLNFLADDARENFFSEVADSRPNAILLGGDIAESHDLIGYLEQMAARWSCPIYFVLGNHDFYFGSIAGVRGEVERLCSRVPNLVWLSQSEPVELSPDSGLVGHDGWADARLGDYLRSMVMMNDYRLIEELAAADKLERWPLLKALGDEAANHLRRVLPAAAERFGQVVVLTHVPPLREACWYEGQISNDEWLPHFTCQAVGDVLLEMAARYPHRRFTVLCGHTHSRGEANPAPNLTIFTGHAEYGQPEVQHIFEF
jgi:calcineurin-like phosphoesterase family protein